MGTNLSCTVIFLTVSLFHSVVFGLIKTGLIRSSLLNHQETCNKGWKRVQNSCTCSCASRLSTDSPFVLSSHFIFPECSLAYVKRFSGNEISVLLRLFCCNHKFTLFATFLIQCYWNRFGLRFHALKSIWDEHHLQFYWYLGSENPRQDKKVLVSKTLYLSSVS